MSTKNYTTMQKYKKIMKYIYIYIYVYIYIYMHLQDIFFKQQLCILLTLIDSSHFVHKSFEIQLLKNNNEIFYVSC